MFFFFFFNPHLRTFFSLLLEREEGRGETSMWERNINWLLSCMHPNQRSNWQPAHVLWPGIEPSDFQSVGRGSNQLSHIGQGQKYSLSSQFPHCALNPGRQGKKKSCLNNTQTPANPGTWLRGQSHRLGAYCVPEVLSHEFYLLLSEVL